MKLGKKDNKSKDRVFSEIGSRIDELRSAHQSRVSDISARIAEADEIIDRCGAELDQVVDNIDEALNLQDELKRARDEKNACVNAIGKLDAMPLISDDEKSDYEKRLMEIMRESNDAANGRINELLCQIILVYQENEETLSQGNKLLRSIAVDLSRDCYEVDQRGVRQLIEDHIPKYVPSLDERLDSVLRPFNSNPLAARLRKVLGLGDNNYAPLVQYKIL